MVGGGGSHYNKEALCTVEYMCCSKLSKFWKFGKKGFFLGGGEVHSAHYDKELHCTVCRLCCSWLYLSVPDSPLITCILVSHRVTVRRRYVFVQTVWELWETPVE